MNIDNLEYIKMLIEKGKFLYIVSNKDFITEAVNPYFTEFTGYTPEEIIGKKSTEVLDPPEIEREVEDVLRALESKGKFEIHENPIVIKSGELKHILWYNVWDEKNQKHISIGIDITDLRETERELKERDEYIFRLTNEAGAYIWRTIFSKDGKEKTVYYTDSVEKILGYPKEYFLNKEFIPPNEAPFRKIVHPDDIGPFEKKVRELLMRGIPLREELRLIKRTGEIIWVYEYLAPILEDGRLKEVLGIGIDITENKKKQRELEEKTRELEFLLNIINAYIFRVYLYTDGTPPKVLYYSEGIKNVTGYTREEFMRGEVSWEEIVYPPDREIHRKEVEEKALKGLPAYVEYRIRRKDGALIWVLDSVQCIPKEDGPIEVIGVCIDIDERKRMEEERNTLEKLQAIGFIAGSMSHIFNNILTGILGYTSLMKLKLPAPSAEYEMLTHIEEGITKMAEINAKLLGYARLGKYREEILDLNTVLKGTVEKLRSTIEVKGVNIFLKLCHPPCVIKGDESQIKMIFKIIIEELLGRLKEDNYIKIRTDICRIEEKDKILRPHIMPGRYAKVVIEDDGPNLTDKELSGIFEPTSSPDALLTGSGFSFPAVYGVVKSHGGFIYIEKRQKRGTKIIIYFPSFN